MKTVTLALAAILRTWRDLVKSGSAVLIAASVVLERHHQRFISLEELDQKRKYKPYAVRITYWRDEHWGPPYSYHSYHRWKWTARFKAWCLEACNSEVIATAVVRRDLLMPEARIHKR